DTSGTTTIRRGSSPHVAPIDRQAVTVDPFDGDRRPTGSHRDRDHLDPVADPIDVDPFAPTDDELRLAARNEHRRRLEVGVILRREERRPGPLTLARLYRLAELADAAGRPIDARRWRAQATTIRSAARGARRHFTGSVLGGVDRADLHDLGSALCDVLNDRERRVLMLHMGGRSTAEIAERLWMPEPLVESVLVDVERTLGGFLADARQRRAVAAQVTALRSLTVTIAHARRPRARGAGPRRSVRTVGRRASCGNGNGGSSGGSPGESDPAPPTPAGSVGRLSPHKPAQVVTDRIGGAR
ncbi:MAG: hypothetical protein M0P31_08460, partial [Solirubrobacteraceae bacterium]|nr:hypothetical protein [Solirubrobacteraceae bacterium]